MHFFLFVVPESLQRALETVLKHFESETFLTYLDYIIAISNLFKIKCQTYR